jgi:hypothetical protein
MKYTIRSESDFADRFQKVRPSQFSRAGLCALFAYLEELERDLGEEIEFDPIGLCCDWTEYANATEACAAYGHQESDADKAFEWLLDQTHAIDSGESVLVLNF